MKTERVDTVENRGEHCGGQGHMHNHILELKPNAVITYGLGPRGLNGFQEAGIAVLMANADTVKDVIESYKGGNLQELTEGCHHACHQ